MKEKKIPMKLIALAMTLALVLGCGIGGTLAWLTASSNEVANTFTVGNIKMSLYEHTRDSDGNLTETPDSDGLDDYRIVPGSTEKKDPTVEIASNSENCYVFLQVKEVNNSTGNVEAEGVADKYVSFTVDNSVWTLLENGTDIPVYYATTNYTRQNDAKTYNVLSNKQVSYSEDLTRADMDALGTNSPKLIFKAFAVQKDAATSASEAWSAIPNNEKLTN